MKPNIKEIKKLIEERFNGNQSEFARAIMVDRTQVSRVIKEGRGAGAQFFGGLMSYCRSRNMDFDRYVFLPHGREKI